MNKEQQAVSRAKRPSIPDHPVNNRYFNLEFGICVKVPLEISIRIAPDVDFDGPGAWIAANGVYFGEMPVQEMLIALKKQAELDIVAALTGSWYHYNKDAIVIDSAKIHVAFTNDYGLPQEEWEATLKKLNDGMHK